MGHNNQCLLEYKKYTIKPADTEICVCMDTKNVSTRTQKNVAEETRLNAADTEVCVCMDTNNCVNTDTKNVAEDTRHNA